MSGKSEIKDRVRDEVFSRIEQYLSVTPERLIVEDSDANIPLWLALCQMFDLVSDGNRHVDFTVGIRNGKIPYTRIEKEHCSPIHPNSQYARILDGMKRKLPE